jgi:hypothetical protein
MRRALTTLAFLAALSGTARADHDCRIRGIDISVTHQNLDGLVGHRVVIHYVGADGGLLSPILCPDQNDPTISSDVPLPLQPVDQLGYVYWVEDPGPGVYSFWVGTYQGDRPISRTKRFTFR